MSRYFYTRQEMTKYRILEFNSEAIDYPFEIQERGYFFGWNSVYCCRTLKEAKALIQKWRTPVPETKLITIHEVE